jgi:hypothetical protein
MIYYGELNSFCIYYFLIEVRKIYYFYGTVINIKMIVIRKYTINTLYWYLERKLFVDRK